GAVGSRGAEALASKLGPRSAAYLLAASLKLVSRALGSVSARGFLLANSMPRRARGAQGMRASGGIAMAWGLLINARVTRGCGGGLRLAFGVAHCYSRTRRNTPNQAFLGVQPCGSKSISLKCNSRGCGRLTSGDSRPRRELHPLFSRTQPRPSGT